MRALGSLACVCLAAVASAPRAQALPIEFSNPYHYVSNSITESKIGEDFATYAVLESGQNATGELLLASDIGYATAQGESDPFSLRSSSSADGSNLVGLGLDSVSSEGLARFHVDFVVSADDAQVLLEIAYVFSSSFVSTDPRPGFGQPGTGTLMGIRSITVWDGDEFVFGDNVQDGSHVLEGVVDSGRTYQLRMAFNTVSGVKESTGLASASAALDAGISARAIPEPTTGALLASALATLAWRSSSRRAATPPG